MINFLISVAVIAVSAFLLVVSLRYGLVGAEKLDNYFSYKKNSNFKGFQWYYRIPFSLGLVPEYFYAMVLGFENYFYRNWWSLKTASFVSVFVFIASLKSRSAVSDYFSFDFLKEGGFGALFSSGNLVILMNIVVVLYLALFVLICIESIKMHGIYAPVRILTYSVLSAMMAVFTILTLSVFVFVSILYFAIKLIGFFFFSNNKKKEKDTEESGRSILMGGFRDFKADYYEWEKGRKKDLISSDIQAETEKPKRKRPKITRRKKTVRHDDEIPRLHPD